MKMLNKYRIIEEINGYGQATYYVEQARETFFSNEWITCRNKHDSPVSYYTKEDAIEWINDKRRMEAEYAESLEKSKIKSVRVVEEL
jgi:hypothetical protein